MRRRKVDDGTAPNADGKIASQPSVGLTTEQLAAAISYHEESVRRAIRQGRIRALPFGRNWRIPPDEVARILAHGLPYTRGAA